MPRVPANEPGVLEAAWVDPFALDVVSPFIVPLIEQELTGWPNVPISFVMTHRINGDGLWAPAAVLTED